MKVHYREMSSGRKWVDVEDKAHLCRSWYGHTKAACGLDLTEEQREEDIGREPTCEACFEHVRVGDLILKERTDEEPYRQFRFPNLKHCMGCGGYKGFTFRRQDYNEPNLAIQIALIEYGLTKMRVYDNGPPSTHACGCEARLEDIKKEMEGNPINEDSGWSGLSGGRCITDYTRTITFEVTPSGTQLEMVKEWLTIDKCPGWTGVICIERGKNTFEFHTTWDSSD